jgi:hypothetical protein
MAFGVGAQTPALHYADGIFTITDGEQTEKLKALSGLPQPDRVVYRKDANFVVWDSRGLTIRKGKKTKTSRLPDVALTPKLFDREGIIANRNLIATGVRKKAASSLSGSRRIADKVFLLVRWTDKYGETWLEALFSADLDSPDLQPKLVGRFDGMTTATHAIDDLLFSDPGHLRIIAHQIDSSWGIASYNLTDSKFEYKGVGVNLNLSWRLGPQTAMVEERTSYGSRTLSRLDVVDGAKRVLRELEGSATLLSNAEPVIAKIDTPTGTLLQNMDSGAELALSPEDSVALAGSMTVIWPKNEQTKAVLFDSTRWTPLAKVVQNQSEPADQSSHSHSRPKKHGRPASHPNL